MNSEKLDVTAAAEKLGVSVHSIDNYARAGHLRRDDTGLFDPADIELAIQLRAEHTRNSWYKHTPWYVEPEETDEADTEQGGGITLAGKLVARAKELKAASSFERACELFEMVVDEYDFGNQT